MTIYCIVPSCKRYSRKNPFKLFFHVPFDQKRRNLWFEAIGLKTDHYSVKSRLYICEDHFNLQEDLENYLQFKYMGGNKRMKPHVVPHRALESTKKIKLEPDLDIDHTHTSTDIEQIILKPDPELAKQIKLEPDLNFIQTSTNIILEPGPKSAKKIKLEPDLDFVETSAHIEHMTLVPDPFLDISQSSTFHERDPLDISDTSITN